MSICKIHEQEFYKWCETGDKMSYIVKFNNEKYADDYHNV